MFMSRTKEIRKKIFNSTLLNAAGYRSNKKRLSNSETGKTGNMFLVTVIHGITFRNGTLDK